MTAKRVGVYPGTFDPVTNGHLDIIKRASHIVDHLIVAVAVNVGKEPLFSLDERTELLVNEAKAMGGSIEVRPFDNLLMHFVDSVGANLIVRGLRAVSDFEYEFQMAGMNTRLNPDVETVFLMASDKHQFIASRLVKEVCRLGGDCSTFISPAVGAALKKKFGI